MQCMSHYLPRRGAMHAVTCILAACLCNAWMACYQARACVCACGVASPRASCMMGINHLRTHKGDIMRHNISDITMKPTGRARGPVAMGAIRLGSRDTFTTDAGSTAHGPGVVSVWLFRSGRMVGQFETSAGTFETLTMPDAAAAVEVTR